MNDTWNPYRDYLNDALDELCPIGGDHFCDLCRSLAVDLGVKHFEDFPTMDYDGDAVAESRAFVAGFLAGKGNCLFED